MSGLADDVELFPVRHHSPRASAVLRARFDVVKPRLILVEGPSDATSLIDAVVDAGSVPPIALLAYRTDAVRGHVLWPFASYSPEYQALKWAQEHGVEARFIDLTIGQSLARADQHDDDDDDDDDDEGAPNSFTRFGLARGMRSFEEAWEAFFEAPAHDDASFKSALLAYADVVRSLRLTRASSQIHRARDAVMRQAIVAASKAGHERIAVVAGAAHIAAIAAGDVDDDLLETLPVAVPAAVTLVPYSFTRLAAQSGYGAGNRAPRYYERASGDCDYERATLETFVDVGSRLRARGFQCSLADVLEAFRLAKSLADLRGKSAPGLDEVRESAASVMGRGDANVTGDVVMASVIGNRVGLVSAKVGRNALQMELEREVRARRLPWADERENFVLKLADPLHLSSSIFLHRLRIASVPYAAFIGTRSAAVAAMSQADGAAQKVDDVGGIAALTRAKESWEARWSPGVDVAVVEAIVHGSSFAEVATRLLGDRLALAGTTNDAAQVLLEAVVTDSPAVVDDAVAACEARANDDDDLGSLASACRAFSTLITFGAARSSALQGDTVVTLCQRTFARALMRAPEACRCSDEGVKAVQLALRNLHETAQGQAHLDTASWFTCAHGIASDDDGHPACAGLAAGLLALAGVLHDEELVDLLALKLSPVDEPARGARFLEGFLTVNAMILCRSRLVVASLDRFLNAIPAELFPSVLPPLRRALAVLGTTERRYLLENVLAVRGIDDHAGARAIVTSKDQEQLKAAASAAALALDDLDDLL
ncbi:MAG: DUF5682 family protein [Deltaproteobacteria bacterium]|nr:DUF5682 family protein [Deltaproteobacteria bacterium]